MTTTSEPNETDASRSSAMGEGTSVMRLLQQARTGDDNAREQLFARCRSYVGLVARARVESWYQAKIDASDLVQQTLLDVHRGLEGFRGQTEAEWLAWLRKILSHNTVDFVRQYRGTEKRQLKRERSLDQPDGHNSLGLRNEPTDPVASPSEFVMQHERELQLADAVMQLPADYQEVIVLRNMQRLSFQDVAERMGRSRPAVQMLWLRALKQLEQRLTADDCT